MACPSPVNREAYLRDFPLKNSELHENSRFHERLEIKWMTAIHWGWRLMVDMALSCGHSKVWEYLVQHHLAMTLQGIMKFFPVRSEKLFRPLRFRSHDTGFF